ncbi:GyrI-like domain-containing protein [Serratia fonticola]|uniref:GyrI-like domain-containing protein n=1 Tax=Serratia fonticola TaxID=47917 RepID=A0AAJ2D580_SERFO|nr:GyrI-like domain-containing protein [Serratia fonticola]MDQ9125002.1 GyrI-like domain-containing protein [Serratia fonticola]
MFEINIMTLAPMRIIGLPYKGSYSEIGQAFTELYQLVTNRQLFRPSTLVVAIFYDDTDVTPVEKLRAFAAISAPVDVPAESPLVERSTPGGDHAVLVFKGPYAGLHDAYKWLFETWLPDSGRTMGNAPSYEVYLNDPSKTSPSELLTEIRVPLNEV